MDPIKILWWGDGGVATGFARVNHSIVNNLPKGKYEVHHLAINYMGDPYPDTKALLYPAALGGDLYGLRRVKSLIDKIKPDMIFALNDTWILQQCLEVVPEDIPMVVYFPVDAKPLLPQWIEALVERTVMVAYTEFGRGAILDAAPDATVRVLPHGVDTNIFRPMRIKTARSKMTGLEPNDFVVLNANRNQPRKRIDLTIKGFALFAKDKPQNVKLYCHMGVEDMGWHLLSMFERYNIIDRLVITSLELNPVNAVSIERLNWIYNACDVGLNTSMGEGWGLTTFEHGACKRAQIVPDSSAGAELYKGKALLLPIDHYETYPKILTEGAVTTPEAVAEALEIYYTDKKRRKDDAERLYQFITSPQFSWRNIAKRWDELFTEVLE